MLRFLLAFLFLLSPTPPEGLIFSPLSSEDEVSTEIARPEVGAPWVRAVAVIDAPPDTVCTILSRFSDYAKVFADNIDSVQVLDAEGPSQRLHIVWGLPFPFRDRDAVVRYSIEKNERGCVVRWRDAAQPGDPKPSGIRIQQVEGSTVVDASSNGLAKVVYFYYAELGGDLYSWAKESAFRGEPVAYVEAIRKAVKQPTLPLHRE
jgi:hypothetical protein